MMTFFKYLKGILSYTRYRIKNITLIHRLKRFSLSTKFDYNDIKTLCEILPSRAIHQYDNKSLKSRDEKFVEKISSYTSVSNNSFLDVGTGYGASTLAIAAAGASLSVGIDIILYDKSIEEFDKTRENVKYIKYSGEKIPFNDNEFDIVHTNAMEHFNNPKISLEEMVRVTKKHGKIILLIEGFWDTPDASHFYNHLNIPWSHLLFNHGDLKKFVKANSFNFMHMNAEQYAKSTIEQFDTLNRLLTKDYKDMISDLQDRCEILVCKDYTITHFQRAFYNIFKKNIRETISDPSKIIGLEIVLKKN